MVVVLKPRFTASSHQHQHKKGNQSSKSQDEVTNIYKPNWRASQVTSLDHLMPPRMRRRKQVNMISSTAHRKTEKSFTSRKKNETRTPSSSHFGEGERWPSLSNLAAETATKAAVETSITKERIPVHERSSTNSLNHDNEAHLESSLNYDNEAHQKDAKKKSNKISKTINLPNQLYTTSYYGMYNGSLGVLSSIHEMKPVLSAQLSAPPPCSSKSNERKVAVSQSSKDRFVEKKGAQEKLILAGGKEKQGKEMRENKKNECKIENSFFDNSTTHSISMDSIHNGPRHSVSIDSRNINDGEDNKSCCSADDSVLSTFPISITGSAYGKSFYSSLS